MSARSRPSPLAYAAVGVGVLLSLATSGGEDPLYDSGELEDLLLPPESLLYIAGTINGEGSDLGGEDGWVEIGWSPRGENDQDGSGAIQLWRLPPGPFDGTLPEGAELIDEQRVRGAHGGEPEPVYAELDDRFRLEGDFAFAYALVLVGGASVEGELVYSGHLEPDDPELDGVDFYLEITEVEVYP